MDRNGKIIGGCIAVDLWTTDLDGTKYNELTELDLNQEIIPGGNIRLFFLSHLHADHTVGLNSSWSRGPIYTSPVNAKIAPNLLKNLGSTSNLFVPLELDTPHLIPLGDNENDPKIKVTLIDANHVPGSVIFVFRGFFGNVVYTGDFRYTPEMLKNPCLSQLMAWEDIDTLYLDNTYFFSDCTFQSRSDVIEKVVSFIKHHVSHYFYIGTRRLGKERAFVKIAKALNEKLCINEDRMELFRQLELTDVFTTDPAQSRIFIVPQPMITKKFLASENLKRPTIGIWLTALFYRWDESPYQNSEVWDLNIFEYSDHSSQPEIIEFVKRLKPKNVLPIVGVSKSKNNWLRNRGNFEKERNDMTTLQPYLSKLPPKYFKYPNPKIYGLPCAIKGSKILHSTQALKSRNHYKPLPKRLYRGPKGPVYHSSASTASCSNKTIDVTHNQKLKTIEENSDGDVTNENEKLFAEQEEIPNIAHSNPIDDAKVAHTSNYEGLEPEPSKLSESVELYKQNKEILNLNDCLSSNENGMESPNLRQINKVCQNKNSHCIIEDEIGRCLKASEVFEDDKKRICYVDLSPRKASQHISDGLNRSPKPENGNKVIELSKQICDNADALMSEEFQRDVNGTGHSILLSVNQNLSKVERLLIANFD